MPPSRSPVAVSSTFEVSVLVQTAPRPLRLDPRTIVAQQQIPFLEDVGFYHRQRMGFGHFLTRADIESHSPVVMSDVFRGLAGVKVICASAGAFMMCDILMRAAGNRGLRLALPTKPATKKECDHE